MKAVLSNKIYLKWTEEEFIRLHEELTYEFASTKPNGANEIITTLTTVGQNALLIPIGRQDLIPKGYEIVDKRVSPEVEIPEPNFILRPSQQEFVDMIDEDTSTAILNGHVGFGKSYCAIALSYKLQLRTLIICHTVALRDQWIDDIEKVMGFRPGTVGSGKLEFNNPIVVANTQTLVKHIDKYHSHFGLVVIDEAHRTPSTTFTKIVSSVKAKYRIGLTGTLRRKDLKQVLTKDYFGGIIYKPKQENVIIPNIILCHTGIKMPGNEYTPWSLRENKLTQNMEYRSKIINLVLALKTRGKHILIVSDRVEFLEDCSAYVNDSITILGSDENRKEKFELISSGKKDNVWASVSIFKEGLSINILDTLIMAMPSNNDPMTEQLIGRVMRQHPGKESAEVYDIVLAGSTGDNQLQTRMAFYNREKYIVKEISI